MSDKELKKHVEENHKKQFIAMLDSETEEERKKHAEIMSLYRVVFDALVKVEQAKKELKPEKNASNPRNNNFNNR